MKKFLWLLLLPALVLAQPLTLNDPVFLAGTAVASGTSLTSGLAAYWKFDTSSGGTTPDATGNGETLTLNSTAAATGTAFLGTHSATAGASSGWMSRADDATLGIGSGKSFTVSCWVIGTAVTGSGNIMEVGKWVGNDTTKQDYAILTTIISYFTFSVYNLSGTKVTVTNNMVLPTDNNTHWYHLAAGYDDSLQQIWIQVENGPRFSQNCVGVRRTSAPFNVLGDGTGTFGSSFGVDECGFWTRSLSLQEVANLNNGEAGLAYPLTVTSPGTPALNAQTNIVTWVSHLENEREAGTSGAAGNPGNTIVTALVKFYNNMLNAGILGKFYTIHTMTTMNVNNTSAQDNAHAMARWPTYQTYQDANWGPTGGFSPVPRSVTVNGIATDGNGGLTEYYSTGFVPSTGYPSQTSAGISVYTYSTTGDGGSEAGSFVAGCVNGGQQIIAKFSDGFSYGTCGINNASTGNTIKQTALASPNGFYSDNRISSTDHRVYFANSGSAFAQFGSTDTTSFTGTLGNAAMTVFNINCGGSLVAIGNSALRMSYFSIHDGLTSAQCNAEYTNVQQLRVDLGGGYR